MFSYLYSWWWPWLGIALAVLNAVLFVVEWRSQPVSAMVSLGFALLVLMTFTVYAAVGALVAFGAAIWLRQRERRWPV